MNYPFNYQSQWQKNSFNMSTICLLSSRMIWTICTGRLQMLIFEEVSGTSCARHAPPRVFRVASSLCPELSCVHAQSWLWDLAARTSNSSISILHTSARGGNFPKTFYRNFLASPPTEQTASRNSSTEEETGQEVPYLYSIEHVCACIAQVCFCFS